MIVVEDGYFFDMPIKWLKEHDKQVRDSVIDECKEKLRECWLNGTVANRIVKEMQESLEQLKEQNK